MKVQSDNLGAQALQGSEANYGLSIPGLPADGRALPATPPATAEQASPAAEPRDPGEDTLSADVWNGNAGARPLLHLAGVGSGAVAADAASIDRAVDSILAGLG